MLHYRDDTQNITLKQIQDIFNQYWCKKRNVNFADGRENELVYDLIMAEADKLLMLKNLK